MTIDERTGITYFSEPIISNSIWSLTILEKALLLFINFPSTINLAIGVSICCWIALFIGLAPKSGLYPVFIKKSLASPERINLISFSVNLFLNSPVWISIIFLKSSFWPLLQNLWVDFSLIYYNYLKLWA